MGVELDSMESSSPSVNETQDFDNDSDDLLHLEIILYIICVFGTIVDLLIIYIISKYKNMRKPVNIYIMNWLICDAMIILVDPAEFRIASILESLGLERRAICALFTINTVIRTSCTFFMLVLLFQWFFEKTKIEIFDKHCRKIVITVWVFFLVETIGMCDSCLGDRNYEHLAGFLLIISYLLFIICLMVIHCMRRCANPFSSSSSLPIALISSYVLSYILPFFGGIVYMFVRRNKVATYIYSFVYISVYLYPLIIFYLFYKIDKKFGLCLRVLLGKSNSDEINTCFEDMDDAEAGKIEVTSLNT